MGYTINCNTCNNSNVNIFRDKNICVTRKHKTRLIVLTKFNIFEKIIVQHNLDKIY